MTSYENLIQLSEFFESCLGNPWDDSSPVSFQQILLADEQEILASSPIEFIKQWGYLDYTIPQYLGGKLNSLDELYTLTRLLARRDITMAIMFGLAFFAALPIWIAGSSRQKKRLSECLRQGKIGALALTEEEHGTDLTSNKMNAKSTEDGWEISGRKWCVNFATLSEYAVVLCRTNEKGGLLGFSLFYIDKKSAEKGISPTPKLPTHGVRGLDISGFSFDKVNVSKDALIGKEQRGLEITYKVFQISRTLCACLAIGGADTALRLALSYSLQRQLYGKSVFEIPAVKQRLGELFTLLLIADCTAQVMVRACAVIPEKMSLWSAIIKFLIPHIGEDIAEQCAIILGARAYLRTTQWAIFQKIRRDIQVVGLFDGSTQVNLSLIAGNLLPQAGMRGKNRAEHSEKIEKIFNVRLSCPPFKEDGLGLFTHEEDDVLAGIMCLNSTPINPLITTIRHEIEKLDQEVNHLHDLKLFDPRSLTVFRLAEKYCWIFAASCCLQFWHYNQGTLSDGLQNTEWLDLAMQLILKRLNSGSMIDSVLQEAMSELLYSFFQKKQLFSIMPIHIAE
ncbi:TPA: acyl-CoA dehydrogenase [Legionella pneumophila]|uniref:acyl-CoA dehydrogenase n=1 Tax=Legionella pneumophila TaxID=446 RepID=UPI00078697AF|nr:acyl-CoA dehydrogenase [Legionella pneumophila]HAU1192127.1 acyl-CoA dehydrogenase [Legionella pneumophila]HAU1654314.1 acyl-CoA dehydrogenase [Legionella pneumophila]HBD7102055.1 acyl-CoA dehydrogenase [Legionella pneumophila]HCO4738744.1 acyl-CoA dehydrogenase [Legionella pneumophila]HDU7929660.1 acyl-CoA dehydrogenase [Legionella pneumophila]